jgi:hypothetical protein
MSSAAGTLIACRGISPSGLRIQVKSKGVDAETVTPVESRRVAKTVDKATRQFRALGEAMNSSGFVEGDVRKNLCRG